MSKQKDNKRIGKSLDKGKRTKPFGKDTRGKKPKETPQNKPQNLKAFESFEWDSFK